MNAYRSRTECLRELSSHLSDKSREELLRELHARLEKNYIFFPDIWARLVQTDTAVLREICASDFEREIFERVRPSRNL